MVGQMRTKVPVYLPDRTVIGSAEINLEDGIAMVTIQSDSNFAEFMSEGLIGLSVVHLSSEKVEKKETPDE